MGIDEVEIDEVGIDEVGNDKVGIDKVGIDKVGTDEVGINHKVVHHRHLIQQLYIIIALVRIVQAFSGQRTCSKGELLNAAS